MTALGAILALGAVLGKFHLTPRTPWLDLLLAEAFSRGNAGKMPVCRFVPAVLAETLPHGEMLVKMPFRRPGPLLRLDASSGKVLVKIPFDLRASGSG